MKPMSFIIVKCGDCPLLRNGPKGNQCSHPFWTSECFPDKKYWDSMLHRGDVEGNGVPLICPLRNHPLTTTIELSKSAIINKGCYNCKMENTRSVICLFCDEDLNNWREK